MDKRDEILQLVKEDAPDNPLEYIHDIVRGYAHEKLNEHILNCTDCDICDGPRSLAWGNPNASVMIIGESAPDNNESFPFGESEWEILDTVLNSLNVNQEDLFIINAVNCCPRKKMDAEIVRRTPHKKEVENCTTFVDYAIKLVQPLVIILFGGIALNLFKKESITNARGEWIDVKGIPAIPTYHPGYFIKIEGKKDPDIIGSQKWDFFNDMKRAFMYIQETYPDNNTLIEPLVND